MHSYLSLSKPHPPSALTNTGHAIWTPISRQHSGGANACPGLVSPDRQATKTHPSPC
ncbi:UNVERIFIED_CONTAM: hypothetical protein FKN15_058895 [Acipenser sinensis]